MLRLPRHLLALAVAFVALAGATPAAAVAAEFTDPRDTPTPLDLAAVRHVDDAATIAFELDTFEPFTDPEVAVCLWIIDTDGDGSEDYSLAVAWDPTLGRLVADVQDAADRQVGDAHAVRLAPDVLRVSMARATVGDPAAYDYYVTCWSDVNGDGSFDERAEPGQEIDDAPDGDDVYRHDLSAPGTVRPVQRIAGNDRILTAVEVSKAGFRDGAASTVVLARSDGFADALAGTPLAAGRKGPLLLTPPGQLHASTEAELRRVLSPGSKVHLLGGTAALSAAVEGRVRDLGYPVERYAGDDRYETAILIADRGLANPSRQVLATGLDFPDALSGGAAAAKLGAAVLLTAGRSMPASVSAYLRAHPGTRYAVGGAAAAADPAAEAIAGADRYDTSRLVARRFFTNPTTAAVSSGVNFPDALSGGARAGLLGAPLLLTSPGGLPGPVFTYLDGESSIASATVFGGTGALSTATIVGLLDAVN